MRSSLILVSFSFVLALGMPALAAGGAQAFRICADGTSHSRATVSTVRPGRGCERRYERIFSFDREKPGRLIVQAYGSSCRRATISVTVTKAGGSVIWREATALNLVLEGELASQTDSEIPFERVIGLVENWVSIEPLATAPVWPPAAPHPAGDPQQNLQVESQLDPQRYERLRLEPGRMLCIPVGPETAHCVAFDRATAATVVLFTRGV